MIVTDANECVSGAVECDDGYKCKNLPGSAECIGNYIYKHDKQCLVKHGLRPVAYAVCGKRLTFLYTSTYGHV